MVCSLNTESPHAETTCSRSVTITSHKYILELRKLRERFEFFEKERKEKEKLEQEAARANQDEAINLANEKPGTSISKIRKMQ